jgi:hypothetical protein
MTILYVSTGENKMAAVKVDEKGNLVKIVQTIDPVVENLPESVPEKGPAGMSSVVTEWVSRHPSVSTKNMEGISNSNAQRSKPCSLLVSSRYCMPSLPS